MHTVRLPIFSYPLKSNPCSYALNPSSSDPSKLLIPSYLDTFKVFLPTLYFSNRMNMFIIYLILNKWFFSLFYFILQLCPIPSYPIFKKVFIFTKSLLKSFISTLTTTIHSTIDILLINKYRGPLPTAHVLS